MLLSIALLPIFLEKFWENNKNKLFVSILLSIPVIIWFSLNGAFGHVEETILYDYIPFIILLGALFVITGGILIEISNQPTPLTNTAILAFGAIIASFIGTTGAAMLLIRPILKINKIRKNKIHTILFFIAIVANCGGLLTPLGDPPLFMMYLRGAEFTWFFSLIPEWLTACGMLLVLYYFWERSLYNSEKEKNKKLSMKTPTKIRVYGAYNFIFLGGVIFAVAFINPSNFSFIKPATISSFIREGVILLMMLISFFSTSKRLHKRNHFEFAPIQEVAYLFIGIFITMIPCLIYLKMNAHTIGIEHPAQFYYASGILSSFLDNTPTAVTFHSLAQGLTFSGSSQTLIAGIPELILKAICTASVFWGSMTYIGNGPNFMVKSIVENSGIKMPHFFAYMYKFSIIILLPIFIIIQLIFI